VTVEEALVALLAAVAGILLFIGLAQALGNQGPDVVDERHRPPAGTPRPRQIPAASSASSDPTEDSPRRSPRVLSGDSGG
jgi:hypothetical protein